MNNLIGSKKNNKIPFALSHQRMYISASSCSLHTMRFQWYNSKKYDKHLRLNAQGWNANTVYHHSTYAAQKLSSVSHMYPTED